MTEQTIDRKEALKAHRQERAGIIEKVQAKVKEQNRINKAINEALKDGPMTAPAVAEATGIPVETVFWTLMSMKKYGTIVETGDDGEYYLYALKS